MEDFHNAINPFKRLRIRLLTRLSPLFETGPLALDAQIIQVNNYQHDDYKLIFEQLSRCDKKNHQHSSFWSWYERIKMLARSTIWLARTFTLFQSRQQINFNDQLDYLFIDYAPSKASITNFDILTPSYWGNLKSIIPKGKTVLNLSIPTNREIWSYASKNLWDLPNNCDFQKISPSSLLNRADFLSIILYFLKSMVLSFKMGVIQQKSHILSGLLMNLWSRTIISPNFLQDLCLELSLQKLNITQETVIIYLCEFNSWEFIVTRYFNCKKVKKIIAFDHTFLRTQDLRWQSLDLLPKGQASLYLPTRLAVGNIYSICNLKKNKSVLSSCLTQVEALRFPETKFSLEKKINRDSKKVFIFFEISVKKCAVLIPSIENWIKVHHPNSEVIVKFHPGTSKTENYLGLFKEIEVAFDFDSDIGDLINKIDTAICLGSTSILATLAENNINAYHASSLFEFNFCVLPEEHFDNPKIVGLVSIWRLLSRPGGQIFFRHPDSIRWRELLAHD